MHLRRRPAPQLALQPAHAQPARQLACAPHARARARPCPASSRSPVLPRSSTRPGELAFALPSRPAARPVIQLASGSHRLAPARSPVPFQLASASSPRYATCLVTRPCTPRLRSRPPKPHHLAITRAPQLTCPHELASQLASSCSSLHRLTGSRLCPCPCHIGSRPPVPCQLACTVEGGGAGGGSADGGRWCGAVVAGG
ncbi:hypothetical protein ZWY2020_002554 [Hordeum vulgare]|nr:hypothetical protein ZWY2020_002554 [Hordeum vulgare]